MLDRELIDRMSEIMLAGEITFPEKFSISKDLYYRMLKLGYSMNEYEPMEYKAMIVRPEGSEVIFNALHPMLKKFLREFEWESSDE